ncbi:MAG: tetratricopeptide repeat protein [Acidobacteria bacterium]|nr:tetratricopeptide repeat protein [Acidobacteriota bacterium]
MLRLRPIFVAILLAFAGFAAHGQQPREITISTESAASVWIDGVSYGKTDAQGSLVIRTVSSGAHTLKIRAAGFKEKSQPLTAVQRGTVKVVLVKTTDEAELAFQDGERFTSSDRDKAVEAYRKAVRLRAAYPEAYVAMARVLTDQGNLDEAQAMIASARKLKPIYPEASAVQGRIYKEDGEEAKAIAAFKRAISEGKGFQPEAYAGLGLLYKEKAETFGGSADFENETKYYDLAADNLSKSLKQLSGAPDAIVIYQLLGLVYERQKKVSQAIGLYEEFLRTFPDAPEADAVRSFIVQLKKNNPSQ